MASISNSTVIFTGTSVSDHLRTSTNGVNGVPLRALGKSRLGTKTRDLTVKAKLKKVKKQEYPWPDNPDPNVKGGVLSHVSHFKPLKEKPKTITLDFEKQLVELEKKLTEVRKLEVETGMDFSDQIVSLENKYQQTMKNLYAHLTPIQRVNIARHPNRPTFLDHIFNITEKFVELHGDRAGYDDPAIVTGIGAIDSRRYMFIGQQKGRNTKENIMRNFGMPTPHGYRKALRMMRYADHHGFPIVTFIDTPGAFADLKSEELGQGEAIAHNLREMFGLKVPVVSIVIGEGGSGGALAIGCANKLLMLENAVFYVASPEACAAILWKTAKASPKAAEKLKITAAELCKLQIADGIIPEPLGGAHTDPSWTSQQIKNAINEAMDELSLLDTKALLEHRNLKFRKIGGFQEGTPIHPERKFKMKKKDLPDAGKTPVVGLEDEVENMRQRISNARESSSGKLSETAVNKMIEKLKKEVDFEFSEAIKALGLQERISALRKEVLEARSNGQLITSVLMDKIENLQKQFDGNLSSAPNYESLRNKLDMLKELSRAKLISEKSSNDESVKLELSNKLKEVMNQSDMKEKIESLNAELQKLRTSGTEDIDQETKDRISKMKKDIDLQVANTLKGMGLEVEALPSKEKLLSKQLRGKVDRLKEEINKRIGGLINSSDIKTMIQRLKSEVALAGVAPEPATKVKIKALEDQIKQRLSVAISATELEEKHEELKSEIFNALESEGNGSLKNESFQCENSRVEVSLAANVS